MIGAIRDEDHLDELLSEPTPGVIEALARLDGDVLVLGAGGRLGPGLCRMARRALDSTGSRRKVIALSRFSAEGLEEKLKGWGVETHAADLLAPRAFEFLPDAPLVVHLVGPGGQAENAWATNAFLPGLVARRYAGARLVALSTAEIYAPTAASSGGASETDPLDPKTDEALSHLARERVFTHFSTKNPTALLRLSGLCDLRSGMLVELASNVRRGEPVDVSAGALQVLWQGDALAGILQALALASTPATVLNLAGPETLSVRQIAEFFARAFQRPLTLVGEEGALYPLVSACPAHARFGYPRIPAQTLLEQIAAQ